MPRRSRRFVLPACLPVRTHIYTQKHTQKHTHPHRNTHVHTHPHTHPHTHTIDALVLMLMFLALQVFLRATKAWLAFEILALMFSSVSPFEFNTPVIIINGAK